MKRLACSLVILSILLFACSISTTSTPPVPAANVVCNELSLYLDPALASSYDCQIVAGTSEGMEVYPQYTNLTLQGYVLSDKFFDPHISVFPVQSYSNLLPNTVPGFVTSLKAMIGGGPPPVFTGSFDDPHLPFLPAFNAGQVIFAQYKVIPFVNGSGIRYLTEFAQYLAPVNNTDLFYTYQALTSDGQFWVSAILPINNPILPANADNPPGSDFESYYTDMANQLNSHTSDSYTPTLAALDALVTSITIQP